MTNGFYVRIVGGCIRQASDDEIIAAARNILDARLRRDSVIDSPEAARAYVALQLGSREHEVFAVLFVDAQHQVIEYREMFRGTLTQTSVYPREVVKEALQLNAAAVLLIHCHPSGRPTPSTADERLTDQLKRALGLIDVRVLDHLVVGGGQVVSMAELGLV